MLVRLLNIALQVSLNKAKFILFAFCTVAAPRTYLIVILFKLLRYLRYAGWSVLHLNKFLRFAGSCFARVLHLIKNPRFNFIIAIIITGLILYWQIQHNIVYATERPSFFFKGYHPTQVQIFVYIDNIPTLIHGTFVDALHSTYGNDITFAVCSRLGGGLIYKINNKKAEYSGAIGVMDTPFEVDFLINRLKIKARSNMVSVLVDGAREIALNLSRSGNSDLLNLDRASFNGLTSFLINTPNYDELFRTKNILKIRGVHPDIKGREGLISSQLTGFWTFNPPMGANRFIVKPETILKDTSMTAGTNIADSLTKKAEIKYSFAEFLSAEAKDTAYKAEVAKNRAKGAQRAYAVLAAVASKDARELIRESNWLYLYRSHNAHPCYRENRNFRAKIEESKIKFLAETAARSAKMAAFAKNDAKADASNARILSAASDKATDTAQIALDAAIKATKVAATIAAANKANSTNPVSTPSLDQTNSSTKGATVVGLDLFCATTGYTEEDVEKFIESLIKTTFHYLKIYCPYISIILWFVCILIITCQILVFLKNINKNLDFIQNIEEKVKTPPYERYLSKFIIWLINFLGNLSPVYLKWAVSYFFLYIGYFKDMN